VYADAYRAQGLTELQWLGLLRLRSEDDPPTLSLLGTWLGTEPSTITALVDRLEARGLVARGPDPHDRRRRLLLLTKTAMETLAAIDEQAAPEALAATSRQRSSTSSRGSCP
jgi:DNA-binding MarR family transcriptional regulator